MSVASSISLSRCSCNSRCFLSSGYLKSLGQKISGIRDELTLNAIIPPKPEARINAGNNITYVSVAKAVTKQ